MCFINCGPNRKLVTILEIKYAHFIGELYLCCTFQGQMKKIDIYTLIAYKESYCKTHRNKVHKIYRLFHDDLEPTFQGEMY